MQNSMEIGTAPHNFSRVKDKKMNKRQEKLQEKLRRLQEVMPAGECGGDPLRIAVQHLHATRDKRRQLNAYHQQTVSQRSTPHHTNYSSGYLDSIRDVNRMMVNNTTLNTNTRSNLAQYMKLKQEYNRTSEQMLYPGPGMGQLPAHQPNPNLRYNFYYPPSADLQFQSTVSSPVPYTYWKPWG